MEFWPCAMALISGSLVVNSVVSSKCFDQGNLQYTLAWESRGKSFFDTWNFGEQDYTDGAVRYVGREEARNETMTQAYDSHAIVRPGRIESVPNDMKRRKSIRLSTQQNWTYFLTAMKFAHTPYGCGVWPAFWSNGASGAWPTDGELDMLEYWNNEESEVSFHTAFSKVDGCQLDGNLFNKEGCPRFQDKNNKLTPWRTPYNCQTDYGALIPKNGCAPCLPRLKTGKEYSNSPGVIAAEWTKEYAKVFYIPEAEIPEDLESGAPKPDTWDPFIISYYPFGASERAHPGSCNATGRGIASPQSLVLNIELCGGAGSLTFPFLCNGLSTCTNKKKAGAGDCCTEYMTDEKKSGEAIAKDAFFNISYIKVWQAVAASAGASVDTEVIV